MPHDTDKHHRRSVRLQGYDYSQVGGYFVTICAAARECLFGEVVDGEMHLSAIGEIVADRWQIIPEHIPAVTLDAWVVMPNHMHGIIVITEEHGPTQVGARCRAPTSIPTRGVR
jgi:REP element-mobilizing transposase RayT